VAGRLVAIITVQHEEKYYVADSNCELYLKTAALPASVIGKPFQWARSLVIAKVTQSPDAIDPNAPGVFLRASLRSSLGQLRVIHYFPWRGRPRPDLAAPRVSLL
jgi:hypothetical protein